MEKTERIEVLKDFQHVDIDELHPTAYTAGSKPLVSARCKEVAVAEGWARPLADTPQKPAAKDTGHQSQDSGQVQPSSSQAQARPSTKSKSSTSRAKRG